MLDRSPLGFVVVPLCLATACAAPAPSSAQGTAGATTIVRAADVAARLGRPPRFLVGMGNDLASDHDQDGAYTLGVTLDLHYAYLVGLPGQGGWPDWNAGGTFVNILTDSADAHGVVPMFTLYSMAAWGEANMSVLTNAGYMGPYWSGARLLFQRLAVFGKPAVVHLEPDFWAYAQRHNGNPAAIPVRVKAHAPECSDLPDDLTGMGRCLVRLARTISPRVVIGFHASSWAGSPQATAAYLNAIGSSDADIVVIETLDRDAGCFEAGRDPNCQRGGGPYYWDASNRTSPSFREHLDWAKAIHEGTGRPLLWWQMPFGVPSDTPGGTAGHYRDNRVRYLFDHPAEFAAVGGLGAVFGVGAGNQTYITTDGGQFRNAVHAYFANPTPLPGSPPFGAFDTPANGLAGVTGALAVTGWALDDVGVQSLQVWRDPVAGEPAGQVFVGNATFVEGARPDVASAYPTFPNKTRAGWGYMLLTNMLPAGGNGTFKLHAKAVDGDGNQTLLASRTITCANASATKPFGTIDTPAQGGTATGAGYVVFGWALTPQTASIPADGSTIWVSVDGAPKGHPAYNQYRADIATLFPGYANSGGAVGSFVLDTTKLANGLHTIAWSVTDSLGRADGIGSRYFWVQN
jgi:hypothetical protein